MVFYALFSDRGDLLGEFDTREEAVEALDEVIEADPTAADELAVLAFDDTGRRVGEPIIRAAAA